MEKLINRKRKLEEILNSETPFTIEGLNNKQVYLNELKGFLKANIIKCIHIEIKRIDRRLKELGVEV